MEIIYRKETIGNLNVDYTVQCQDLRVVSLHAKIEGDSMSIKREYFDDGSFSPTASAARLTDEENAAIANTVKSIYDQFGVYQPNISEDE